MTSMPYFNNGTRYFHPATNSFSLLPSPNIIMTPIYLDTYHRFQNYSSVQSKIHFNNCRPRTQRNYRNRGNLTQINNHVPKLTEDLGNSSYVNSSFKIPPQEASLPNNDDINKGDKISVTSQNAEKVVDPETDEFCSGNLDDSIVILAVDPPKEEKEKVIITLSDTEDSGDAELSKVCTSKAEQSQSISVRGKENTSCLKKKRKNKSKSKPRISKKINFPLRINENKKRQRSLTRSDTENMTELNAEELNSREAAFPCTIQKVLVEADEVCSPPSDIDYIINNLQEFCSNHAKCPIPPEEVNLPNNVNMSEEDKISFISPNAENVMDPEIDEFCSGSVDDSIRILAVDPPKQEEKKITITLSDSEDNTDSELSKVCSSRKGEQSESISVRDKVKTYVKKEKKRKAKVKLKNNIQKVNSSIQDEEKIVITLSDSEDIDDSKQSNVCSTKANTSENVVGKKRKKSSHLKKKDEKKVKNKKNILPRKSQRNLSVKTVTKKVKLALKKFKEKNKEVMNPEVNLSNQDENMIVASADTEHIADSKLPSVCKSVFANVAVKHKKRKRTRKKNKNATTNKENILQNKSKKELGLKKVNKKSKEIFKKLKEKLKKKKALRRNLKLLHSLNVCYRRPVVIDGSNVAITHGLPSHTFSAKGIQLCVDFFLKRGHTQITAFVPMFRINDCSDHPFPTVGQEILKDLAGMQHVVYTPSRDVNGKHINSYDDRFIVELASKNGGIIVSNDNYKDLIHESESFRETIEKRLLMFVFVGDLFMVPDDPLGKQGPKLEEFLHF